MNKYFNLYNTLALRTALSH